MKQKTDIEKEIEFLRYTLKAHYNIMEVIEKRINTLKNKLKK